jgi:hypothetical protein
MKSIEDIIKCLTKDERFDKMIWVGHHYSIADLKKDLRELDANRFQESGRL